MRFMSRTHAWPKRLLLLVALLMAGCRDRPTSNVAPSTGAESTARTFFEALIHSAWAEAYVTLDADSKTRCSPQQFELLAQNYVRRIGFPPDRVIVSVSENGANATAVAVFRASAYSTHKQFKVGISLRRNENTWAVVLPSDFGKETIRPTQPK
jgi:hypothetical protein